MKHYLGVFISLLMFSSAAFSGDFPAVKVQKINDRVYAMLGPHDPPNRENGGYMNNNLVIIGDKGVILVDAGSHKDVAEHIDKAIKTVTQKPITHVLITHHHSDHHLGLSYFKGAQVIASSVCAKQIENNGRGMVKWMERNTGKNLRNTSPVVPHKTIAPKSRESMEIDGVRLELITTKTAHTDGDMLVWLPDDGVLASGDILVHTINPSFRDGNLKNWIAVVDDILNLPLKSVMPGHGPLMQREDVAEFQTLITEFYKTIEDIYKAGGAEADVRKKLDLAKWQRLGRFDDMMGGNINKVWLEVEEANF
jgi:glyoxylase-like metal-dependent hydrolase (beta-lactamase superfamily II)